MSVKHYAERRKKFNATAGPVGIPGKPSTTNREYRRFLMFADRIQCDCGQCLPGQDRTCPARGVSDPRD